MTTQGGNRETESNVIRLTIPERSFPIVFCASLVGFSLGSYRGGRLAGKKFLAENAHRAPKTVQGWYFYNKTKNYKIMQMSLKNGLVDGSKMGGIGLLWVLGSVGAEKARQRAGLGDSVYRPIDDLSGSLSTVAATSIVYKLKTPAIKRLTGIAVLAIRVRPLTNKESGLIEPLSTNAFSSDASLSYTPQKHPVRSSRRIIDVLDDRVLIFDPPDNDPTRSFQNMGFTRPGMKRYKDQRYAFDRVFSEPTTQQHVFHDSTLPLIDGVLDGYNATVFAYGATGCGKTHTISGTPNDPGIIIRTMNELFTRIHHLESTHNVQISLSYLEIYNEMIRDLLAPPDSKAPRSGLALQESAGHKISVAGLSEHHPDSPEQVLLMILDGNKKRTMSPTMANATSSRSHAVLQINVKKRQVGHDSEQCATLSIIDLAGSERASATQNSGKRMTEGANINKSLLALGNCINALCEGVKGHIPYRNSKLTRLLKFSLGGNCRTVMIVCVSPFSQHYEDTQNTLKYANRAKNIKTKVSKNIINVDRHVREYVQMIAELREQNGKLQGVIDSRSDELSVADQRKRQYNYEEMVRVKSDITEKLQATLPSITKGAAWEALLLTSTMRAQPLEMRLGVLNAEPSAHIHEIALLSSMLRPLAKVLAPHSAARGHISSAQKNMAVLEATLRAIEEKRYDGMDEHTTMQIRQAAQGCRDKVQLESEKARVDILKNALGVLSTGLSGTTKTIAHLAQIGNKLIEDVNKKQVDYSTHVAYAKSLQGEFEESNALLSSINSNDELPPPIAAVTSPIRGSYRQDMLSANSPFNPPPPLTVNLKSLSPSSIPQPGLVEPESLGQGTHGTHGLRHVRNAMGSLSVGSPKRVHRRLSNYDGGVQPAHNAHFKPPPPLSFSAAASVAAHPTQPTQPTQTTHNILPLPKKSFRWKDEAGEGELYESRRRQSLGRSIKPKTTVIGGGSGGEMETDDNKSDGGWEDDELEHVTHSVNENEIDGVFGGGGGVVPMIQDEPVSVPVAPTQHQPHSHSQTQSQNATAAAHASSQRGPVRLEQQSQQSSQKPPRRMSSSMRPLTSKPPLAKKTTLSNLGEDEEASFSGSNSNSNSNSKAQMSNGSPMRLSSPAKRVALLDLNGTGSNGGNGSSSSSSNTSNSNSSNTTTSSTGSPGKRAGFAAPTASSARRLSKLPEPGMSGSGSGNMSMSMNGGANTSSTNAATSAGTPRTRRLRRGSNIGPMRRGRASLLGSESAYNHSHHIGQNGHAHSQPSHEQPKSKSQSHSQPHSHTVTNSSAQSGPVRFNPGNSLNSRNALKSPRKGGRRSLMPSRRGSVGVGAGVGNNTNSTPASHGFGDFSFTGSAAKPGWK
ncbi:hypothetical protein E3P92_01256 [Wallemia ichthyophaga]|nr:hypothetical protein E3P97_01270 [Wallemia ichthyophaga]TIB16818.1 hypothetical protein E3P92_01256 [Wallemia ichthyophaga]TIB34164.1 hypothetical protein E3P85_01019 [Wallemia ichthyophaga]TIB48562.1 hypothetical protein E3P82_01268 [Wallemia ichthyophaga]TIB52574.1 hypothetical protein E3P81_01269 [Wallemia ichthyophaga]